MRSLSFRRASVLLIFLLFLSGCSGDSATPSINDAGAAPGSTTITLVSAQSQSQAQIAAAQTSLARAVGGAILAAPFTSLQITPKATDTFAGGTFQVNRQDLGGGAFKLTFVAANGDPLIPNGTMFVNSSVANGGNLTVTASLGDPARGIAFFGCTGYVTYQFDAAYTITSVQFHSLVAAVFADGAAGDQPKPVGGTLTLNPSGQLAGQLGTASPLGKSIFENVGDFFTKVVVTVGKVLQGVDYSYVADPGPYSGSGSLDSSLAGDGIISGAAGDQGYHVAPNGVFQIDTSLASAGIIGNTTAGIISHNGGNLIGGNSAGIISHNGGNLISPNGAGLISPDGAGLISPNGAGLISPNGAGILASGIRSYGGLLASNIDSSSPSTLGKDVPTTSVNEIVVTPQLKRAVVGDKLAFSVFALDKLGNIVPITSTLGVWQATSNSTTLALEPVAPGVFKALSPGTASVTFTETSTGKTASAIVTVLASGATQVIFRSQPVATQSAGTPIVAQGGGGITVSLADNSRTPLAFANVPVTINLNTGGTAQLQGNAVTLLTDNTGSATFTNLILSGAGTGLSLRVSSTGLAATNTSNFNLASAGLPSGTRQGYLFVGNFGHGTSGPAVIDSLRVLKFDFSTGVLTDGGSLALEDGAHATHILISQDKKLVFVVGNQSNKVYVYNFNSATGTLTLATTYPTGGSPFQLLQSPSAPNRFYLTQQGVAGGSGSLRELDYSVGTATLTQIGVDLNLGTACSGIDGFSLNNGFDYLYVANTGNNTISALKVNATSGAAQVINTGATGSFPSEVVLDQNSSERKLVVSNRGASAISQFGVSSSLDIDANNLRFGALRGVNQSNVFVTTFENATIGKTFPSGPNPRGLSMAIGSAFATTFLYTANSAAVLGNANGISAFVAGSIDTLNPPQTRALTGISFTGTAFPSGGAAPTGSGVVFGHTVQVQATAPQFLYITNRNSDSLGANFINLSDGTLTTIPPFALNPGDQPFCVSGATFLVP